MERALSFLIRYFSNYYTLHRSDLAARAAPLDPRLYYYKQNCCCEGKVKIILIYFCVRLESRIAFSFEVRSTSARISEKTEKEG